MAEQENSPRRFRIFRYADWDIKQTFLLFLGMNLSAKECKPRFIISVKCLLLQHKHLFLDLYFIN